MNLFADFDTWKGAMRVQIQGASIARQCHDMMDRGLGMPSAEDMRRFREDAAALADLWEDTIAD